MLTELADTLTATPLPVLIGYSTVIKSPELNVTSLVSKVYSVGVSVKVVASNSPNVPTIAPVLTVLIRALMVSSGLLSSLSSFTVTDLKKNCNSNGMIFDIL